MAHTPGEFPVIARRDGIISQVMPISHADVKWTEMLDPCLWMAFDAGWVRNSSAGFT
jgi:hypothetical protein